MIPQVPFMPPLDIGQRLGHLPAYVPDRHRVKAAAIFGVAYADVTAEQRRFAKQITFGDRYSSFR